ncbi:MAG: hypothetical protein Q8942_16890, partial [Bacillota bacterium]|nr:hypothetical protein [Bacillota bacterium]
AGISGCSSGGELITIESARFSDVQQSTDGNVCHMENYWNSLITPPDKLNTYYGQNNGLGVYDKRRRGGMNCSWSFDSQLIRYADQSASVDPNNLESLRKDVELYHFFKKQNVVGRWVKVYRPTISGGYDPTFYMQKMDGSNTKGYIVTRDTSWYPLGTPPVTSSAFGQNVTIYPKGLISSKPYTISTLEGGMAETTHDGSYWMSHGIPLTPLNYGEIIFLNIDKRPGAGKDTTAPSAPSNVIKVSEKNVGHEGIGITWTAGSDDNWISYYEIFKNGSSIDKVSKGTYYFDTTGSIGDTYEVRTVDGDGNVSSSVAAQTNPEQYSASIDFSQTQGQRNWYYQQRDSSGNYTDMAVDGSSWKGAQQYCLIGSNFQHPDTNDSVRKWIAPRTGAIRITGTAKMLQTGGDGVVVSILQNNQVIWGPKTITGTDLTGISHDFTIGVCEGDDVKFIVNKNGDNYFDSTLWDPTIIYVQSHRASVEFSSTQGSQNWYYQQLDSSGNYTDMTWDAANFGWRGNQTYCIIGSNSQHPDTNDSVRKWVAPKTGTINISGLAKAYNTGGDGVYLSIKKNNANVWGPTLLLSSNTSGIKHNFNVLVQQGDSICFVVNKNGDNYFDSTVWDPSIYYLPEAATNSALDYSPDQGRKNWSYQEKDSSGNYKNLIFDKTANNWKGDEQYCFLDMGGMHPGANYDTVRKWVAPYPGKIRITGNYSKLNMGGDGVILKILRNTTAVNTITLSDAVTQVLENDLVNVNAGDEVIFDLNRNGDNTYDATAVDMNIQYE